MASSTHITSTPWGHTPTGQPVQLFTLRSASTEVSITNFGATITSVRTPDRNGTLAEITLGADELAPYLASPRPYLGATIGRFGNRLAKGTFSLDGHHFHVPLNDGPNSLHGGPVGFDQKLWSATTISSGVRMTCLSPDGEMGFPGTLTVHVDFTLLDDTLRLDYTATTDRATIVNLTNHTYWNLSGNPDGALNSIASHTMQLRAAHITPVDATLIPTGELLPVAGTPFDLLTPRLIGQLWDSPDVQIQLGHGYDHNWVLNTSGQSESEPDLAAVATDPATGRTLSVYTTEPGIQFYSGNFLQGTFVGRNGHAFQRRSGFCLETQHFPDSPNQPAFPSTRLNPGTTLRSTTLHVFGTLS